MKIFRVLMLLSVLAFAGCGSNDPEETETSNDTTIDLRFDDDSPLISIEQLDEIRENNGVCIIEVGQDPSDYKSGHIPGAQFVHWVTDITDPSKTERYNIIDQSKMQELLGRLGITPKTRVVIYDRLNSRLSTRMFWSLKYYKHPQVQIMNGTFETWSKYHSATTKARKPSGTQYKISGTDSAIITNKDFISQHLDDATVKLVDGRPEKQYNGKSPGKVFHTGRAHKKRGHIPGAVNVVWKDNFNSDGTFKSLEQLQELYSAQGVTSEQTVISYCNEGLHAAAPWFVLSELLEYPDVRLYDDSMSEWANSDEPVEVGDGN